MSHELYMNRCFQLARLGTGNVAPNPLVGAVVVHNEMVIAEGFHKRFGGPHAEVMALNQLTDAAILEKSTLYVNLEPCSHTGKTPPCSDLIITKGIKNVVISNRDPFPQVNGSGIAKLQMAGIHVTEGILEEEGKLLNRRFFTFHNCKRPYIILKWAMTRNGFVAPLSSSPANKRITWISNPLSRLLVHRWRSEEQSILVGRGTVLADNPKLNVRGISGNNPLRLIIDPKLSLKKDFNVFDKSVKTFVFNTIKQAEDGNITYVKIADTDGFLHSIMNILYNENIQSVLVEGGSTTLNYFIKAGLWDEARVFTGLNSFEEGIPAPEMNGLLLEKHEIAGDFLNVFFNQSVG